MSAQRLRRRRRRVLALLVVVQVALVISASPVLAASPLPACRYADVTTKHPWYATWRATLLDTIYRVPSSFAPADRVSTANAGLSDSFTVRSLIIQDLRAMSFAARDVGAGFKVQSAYRSYQTQQAVYQGWVDQLGEAEARKISARPGHSEHQLGTTLDLRSQDSNRPPWDYPDWATTKAGAWLKANAWKYGFVMSYPKGREATTCYAYEPWHYRYFGRKRAAKIHQSGLTTRQWLWISGGY